MEHIREAVVLHYEEELERGEQIQILTISEYAVGPLARASGC